MKKGGQLILTELIPFSFVVLCISYIVTVILDILLPGFAAHTIDLDLFLWLVILLGVVASAARGIFKEKDL